MHNESVCAIRTPHGPTLTSSADHLTRQYAAHRPSLMVAGWEGDASKLSNLITKTGDAICKHGAAKRLEIAR
jgi:hypothetical protein